jgi:Family of unknown function (DUF6584)
MSKPDVLTRVSADLALGHTQPAIQRLSSLVAAHPTDLHLRRRLARLHRMVGNWIEAGRWDYLTPGADTGAVAAFERAFPSPSRRLAALRWPQRSTVVGLAATGYARARLEWLARAATNERPHSATGTPATARMGSGRRSACIAGLAVAGLAVAFFVALGAVTVAQWLLG